MKLFGAWFLPLCNGYFVLSLTRPRIYWARSLQWPNYSDAVIPELSTAFVLKLPLNSPFSLVLQRMPHISLKLTPAQAGALGVRPLAWIGWASG
jgi:hypothetical protein